MVPVEARAPVRLDLAGGTVDIWPLYLTLPPPVVTVNVALDLPARARVVPAPPGDTRVRLESLDRAVAEDHASPQELRRSLESGTGGLRLLARAVDLLAPQGGLSLLTEAESPEGAGLGGSSALLVAVLGALQRAGGRRIDPDRLRPLAQDIEAWLLRGPTGYQDYYPALLGGLNALQAVPGGVEVEKIGGGPEFLAPHLLLVDTGIEHQSGLTNWEGVKRFFDGDRAVRDAFHRILECAVRLRDAARARDLLGVAAAVRDEWDARRRLSPRVTNAKLDALAEAARSAGALAAKVCGAGGGGCMVVLAPDAGDRLLLKKIGEAGGNPLAFRPDPHGLRLEKPQNR
jgi:D-glycero-alpha-D-manno-heptose-7-phosphate kinase